jgi:hypothetical protein
MGVFGPVVRPPRGFLTFLVSNHFHRGAIRREAVGHNHFRIAISPHRFLQKRKRSLAIPPVGNEALQNFALVINCAPEIVLRAINLHKNLIQMPSPLRTLAHALRSFLPNFRCEHWPKPVPPKTDALMADVDSTLVE